MPDEFDAPVEQATAAPGEKRDVPPVVIHLDGKRMCEHCGGTGWVAR